MFPAFRMGPNKNRAAEQEFEPLVLAAQATQAVQMRYDGANIK